MTAFNPCCKCKEPLTIESPSKEVSNCGYCGLPVKETLAAVEKDCSCDAHTTGEDRKHDFKDCPHHLDKPQSAKEWWEDDLRGRFLHTEEKEDALISFVQFIAAQSEKKGRGDAVDFIMRESMIEPDFSPHADYIIPFKVLEAARSSEEGKTGL